MVQFDQEALKVGISRAAQRQPRQSGQRGTQAGQAEQQQTTAEPAKYRFKKNVFLKEGGSGTATHERFGREPGIKSEWVDLDENIAQEFEIFLSNHLANLLQLSKDRPDLLNNAAHLHDKLVFDYLTTEKIGAGGHTERNMDDADAKIKKFLESGEGWKITHQILVEQTALRQFGLGLVAAVDPEGRRSFYPNEVTVPLNIDQGALNKQGRKAVEWLSQFVNDAGGRPGLPQARAQLNIPFTFNPATGAPRNIGMDIWPIGARRWHMSGVVGGSAAGLAAGGAAALGPAGLALGVIPLTAAGLWHEIRNGVQMSVTQTTAGLNLIQSNPAEAEYLYKMTGIDVNDFAIAGPDQIDFARPPEELRTNRRVDEIRAEVVGNIITRMEFMTKIGVPLEDIDASPFQRLFNSLTGTIEQTGTRWQDREQQIFNDLGGFVAGDPEENARRQFQAERQVTTEMMQTILTREISEKSDIRGATTTMKNKRSEMADDDANATIKTEYRQKRTEELGRRKTRLEAYRTGIDSERTAFNSYDTLLENLKTARQNAQDKYGASTVTDIDTQLTDRRNNRSNKTIPGSFAEAMEDFRVAERTAKDAEIALIPGGVTGKARENEVSIRTKPITEEYDRLRQSLREERLAPLEAEIVELENFKKAILAAERALADDQEQPKVLVERLRDWENNFTTVEGWSIPGTADLTRAALASQDIDEIMARINATNATPPPGTRGWPEARNDDPEFRKRVFEAILEARSRDRLDTVSTANPTWQPNFGILIGPPYNFSHNQLRAMTTDQITANITTRALAAQPPNVIDAAKSWSQAMVQERRNIMDESFRSAGGAIETTESQIQSVDYDAEVRLLDAAIVLSENQSELIKRRGEIIDRNNIGRFTDRTAITGDMTYSQSERDRGARRGYYEFMNYLFNYRERTDRDQYFGRIAEVLTPNRLRNFLVDAIPIVGTRATPLNTVFQRLQDETIVTNNVDDRDMTNVVYLIARTFREEALAVV